MANNKILKDGLGVNFTTKTTDNAGVNTSHVNVDEVIALGEKNDAEASTDTGTFSLIAFIKRAMQNWTTLLSRIPALGNSSSANSQPVTQAVESASGDITTQNLVPNGAATANSAVEITLFGMSTLAIQVRGTYTGVLSIQVTVDNLRWETITSSVFLNSITGTASATIPSAANGIYQMDVSGYLKARITGLAAITGTANITLRAVSGTSLVTIDNPFPAGTNTIGGVNVVTGQTAASTASTGNPVRIGGRIAPTTIATQDATLIAGDASEIGVTPALQMLVKQNATAELDSNVAVSSAATVVTVQSLLRASGQALVRNYITSLRIANDALGAAGFLWILDSIVSVTSIAISTGLVTTGTHDLKLGDMVMFPTLAGGAGVSPNQIYYVSAVPSATTFNFSATPGGANVVPGTAYTASSMYRVLDQIRLQTNANEIYIPYTQPLKGIANTVLNFLIPVSLTSGNIYISVNGYRGF